MRSTVLLPLVIFGICTLHRVDSEGWSYGGNNGLDWGSDANHPFCADGDYSHQSPIDIQTSETVLNDKLEPFAFSNHWNLPVTHGELVNNGHTYQFNDNDGIRSVSGGGLEGAYTLLQFHFHFGSTNSQVGSEHTINGGHYPAEIHFVMYNANVEEDLLGRLAVLGFFIDVSDTTDDTFLDEILLSIRNEVKTAAAGDRIDLNNTIDLSTLPETAGLDQYFRYTGSLTTPPCSPVVIWTVFHSPLLISQNQYNSLLGGTDEDGEVIENNFRIAMPVNDRIVYHSPGTVGAAEEKRQGWKYAVTAIGAALGGIVLCTLVAAVVMLVMKHKKTEAT